MEGCRGGAKIAPISVDFESCSQTHRVSAGGGIQCKGERLNREPWTWTLRVRAEGEERAVLQFCGGAAEA